MPLQITWISVSFVICTLITISTQYCPDGEFTCTDGQCIEHDRSCDGKVDCSDGIDEFGCGDPEPLPTSTTSRNTDSAHTNENGSTHLMPTSSTTRNTDSATMSESGSTHLMPTSTTSRNTDSSPTSESGSTHLMPTTTTSSNTNSATTSENGSTHLMQTSSTSRNTDSALTSESGSTDLMPTSTTSRNTDSPPTSDSRDPDPLPTSTTSRYTDSAITNESVILTSKLFVLSTSEETLTTLSSFTERKVGPPNITMDGGKIYIAHVHEPFTLQFQVESYYSSHVSNVSVVGKDGIERILHEIVDWTQNSTQNVKDIKLFNITLTIVNVTSSITNSKFFVTVRNERGSASASFMLEQKGTATTSNANTESTVENKSGLRGDESETSPLIFIIAITIPAVVIGFIVLFVVFRKHKCKSYNMPGIKDSGGERAQPEQIQQSERPHPEKNSAI